MKYNYTCQCVISHSENHIDEYINFAKDIFSIQFYRSMYFTSESNKNENGKGIAFGSLG